MYDKGMKKTSKRVVKLPLVRQSIRLLQSNALDQAVGGMRRIDPTTCDMGKTCESQCQ